MSRKGAIATAFKKVAAEELEKLYPLKALAEAHQLPVQTLLTEYQQTLVGIQSSASDDCVRILTETGASFEAEPGESPARAGVARREGDRRHQAGPASMPAGLAAACPRNPSPEVAQSVEELKSCWDRSSSSIRSTPSTKHTGKVLAAYKTIYLDLFDRRREAYEKAIDEIKNRPEWEPWPRANTEMAETLLSPLRCPAWVR